MGSARSSRRLELQIDPPTLNALQVYLQAVAHRHAHRSEKNVPPPLRNSYTLERIAPICRSQSQIETSWIPKASDNVKVVCVRFMRMYKPALSIARPVARSVIRIRTCWARRCGCSRTQGWLSSLSFGVVKGGDSLLLDQWVKAPGDSAKADRGSMEADSVSGLADIQTLPCR
jgi:hypothetical protein